MLPTPSELDRHAATALHEAKLALQRGFAEGIGSVRDFPCTLQAFKEFSEIIDKEEAVETCVEMRERLEDVATAAAAAAAGATPRLQGKHVAIFIDGSSTSYAALKWAVAHLVTSHDVVHLVNVIPYDEFRADAERLLQQAYDFAHSAGVRASHLRVAALSAQARSATGGVGESVEAFVQSAGVDVVVVGSRGLGSIKRSLLGAVGMGSVSSFCIEKLTCPVMVVREGCQVDVLRSGAGAETPGGGAAQGPAAP